MASLNSQGDVGLLWKEALDSYARVTGLGMRSQPTKQRSTATIMVSIY